MAKFVKNNLKLFLAITFLISIIVFCFVEIFSTKAEEQIKIFPSIYSSEWQNPEGALSQDLNQESEIGEFNTNNSAYPFAVLEIEQESSSSVIESVPEEPSPEIIPVETPEDESTNTETIIAEPTTTEEIIFIPEEPTTTEEITPVSEAATGSQEIATGTESKIQSPSFFTRLKQKIKYLFNQEVLAEGEKSQSVLVLSGFAVPLEQKEREIKNVQLRVSMAGKGEPGDMIISEYSYGNKNEWELIEESDLDEGMSNGQNGGYFLYGLPFFKNWDELESLQIRFTYLGANNGNSKAYLDAAWLEIELQEKTQEVVKQKISGEYKLTLTSSRKVFNTGEKPAFTFRYQKKQNIFKTLGENILNIFQDSYKQINIKASLEGMEAGSTVLYRGNGEFFVELEKPREFKPGAQKLKIEVENQGKILTEYQDFSWGVLAINTNKSIYLAQETAYLQMAALTSEGQTICDARLNLEIKNPKSKIKNLSTEDGTIQYSENCGPNNVTDVPDYFALYQVEGSGVYHMKLTNLDNGYEISDSFEVRGSVVFEVERTGPTRIYPSADYEVVLRIRANEDFSGQVIEKVPADFEISSSTPGFVSQVLNTEKNIVWDVNWKAGEKYELKYSFDAPDISPYFYLLGPLQAGVFREARQWQIASDAANDVILFWDTANGAVPAGWSCISCVGTDPFYTAFLRASSSYGNATSGQPTHGHDLVYSSATQSATDTARGATGGTNRLVIYTHTHSWLPGPTVTATDSLPLYNSLNLIKATNPTSIPTNTIAIFDSPNIPTGWTLYTGANSSYVRGFTTTGTGGVTSHTHLLNSTTSSIAAETLTDSGSGTVGERAHAHTIGATDSIATAGANTPPFVGVVLAYPTSNATISAGMIAIFDAAPVWGWTAVSNAAPWNGNFLVGSSTFGSTGGTDPSHTHGGSQALTSGIANGTNGTNMGSIGSYVASLTDHTHSVTYTVNASTNYPVFRDVILAKRDTITTVGAVGTQTANVNYNSSNNYLGGAFTLISNTTTTVKVTQIIITDTGTVNANANLSNIRLYYEATSTCGYQGNELYYAKAATFAATEKATIASSTGITISSATTCVYVVLDVGAGALNNDKIDIQISDPSTEVTLSLGNATPSTAVAISGDTNIIGNFTPTVSSVNITASPIVLTENSSTSVHCISSTTDTNGWADIATVTAAIFRSGVGANCASNTNNCYWVSSTAANCTFGGTTTDTRNATCTAKIWFYADPTDASSTYSNQEWWCQVKAIDTANASGTATDTSPPDLQTQYALIIDSPVNYGILKPNASSTATSTKATSTGNADIDINLYGVNLASGTTAFEIALGNQEYSSNSSLVHSGGLGTDVVVSPGANYNLDLVKPTAYPSNSSDDIYWSILIPDDQQTGLYTGTTTISAVAPSVWAACTDPITFIYRSSSVTYGTVTSTNNTCWMDRNLGSSQVATASTSATARGDLFQWGRLDDGHQSTSSNTTVATSSFDTPGHGDFIYGSQDWRSPINDNLWQGVSGTNNPCPWGWRLPTSKEWDTERASWSSHDYNGAYNGKLKLTIAGYRNWASGAFTYDGYAYYWSSTIPTAGTSPVFVSFGNGYEATSTDFRAVGNSVRCIKD